MKETTLEKKLRKKILAKVIREWQKPKYIIDDGLGCDTVDIESFTQFLYIYKNKK